MIDRLTLAATLASVLSSSGCEDACEETRVPLGIDETGPSGEAPIERVGFTEGTRSGTLTWGTVGDYDLEVVTTLASTGNLVEHEHTGAGRLACVDSIEILATVQIVTPSDLVLADTFEVLLTISDADTFTTSIESHREISGHDFTHLGFSPASAPKTLGLDLRLVWLDDAAGTMLGWITIGGDTLMHFEVSRGWTDIHVPPWR